MTGHLIVTDEDATRVITLRRPEKKNAITQEMYRAMSGAIDTAQNNPAIRCIIITGGSGVFTAGNDLEDFLKDGTSNADPPRASNATKFLYSLAHNAKPLIAAVDGVAPMLRVRLPGDNDDRHRLRRIRVAQLAQHLGPVHHRQGDIEDDEIRVQRLRALEPLQAVARLGHTKACPREKCGVERSAVLVVLHAKNHRAALGALRAPWNAGGDGGVCHRGVLVLPRTRTSNGRVPMASSRGAVHR